MMLAEETAPPAPSSAARLPSREQSDDNSHNGDTNQDDSSVNSNDSNSFSTSHNTTAEDSTKPNNNDDSNSNSLKVAQGETKAILRLRILVFSALLVSALVVCIIVYLASHSAQESEYEKQYIAAAKVVTDTFGDIMDSKMGAIANLGVTLIAHAVDDETQEWPFVTLSSFQQRAAAARKQSGAVYFHINPLVTNTTRPEWERYAAGEDSFWIEQGLFFQEYVGLFANSGMELEDPESIKREETWPIWRHTPEGEVVIDDGYGPFMPTWQTSPVVPLEVAGEGGVVNENILRTNLDGSGAILSFYSKSVVLGSFLTPAQPTTAARTVSPLDTEGLMVPQNVYLHEDQMPMVSLLLSAAQNKEVKYQGSPIGHVFFPVFDSFRENRKPVAVMVAWLHWMDYFVDILPNTVQGIILVLKNTCNEAAHTFEILGQHVSDLGPGDLHDDSFARMMRNASFGDIDIIEDGSKFGLPLHHDYCMVSLEVYPSKDFYNLYNDNTPIYMTLAVAVVFVISALLFVAYDRLVARRQALVMKQATQTHNIVTSLFPENVRQRLMEQAENEAKAKKAKQKQSSNFVAPKKRLRGYLDGEDDQGNENDADGFDDEDPIADLFPHCTVLFADIAGFTAWSSTRDPAQVFILLQTVYEAFDAIAKRRKVFKVETIGDSYVAVTGLPEPQPHHAVIMSRFAGECMVAMKNLVSRLETRLGPDTGDLTMRLGLHSGKVTAGVLRGERARFQLFGDTVNTAARMESTGVKNKIQVSESTYKLLFESGKEGWLKPRPDPVKAKGKGTLKTWFLHPHVKRGPSIGSSSSGQEQSEAFTATSTSFAAENTGSKEASGGNDGAAAVAEKAARKLCVKEERLVNWISQLLKEHISKLVAMRGVHKPSPDSPTYKPTKGETALDEVAEIIELPKFCEKSYAASKNHRSVKIADVVVKELHDYVETIALMYYSENPFHNFEHACHVTMAVHKFLKRIVAPDIDLADKSARVKNEDDLASQVHNYTHGINSDPLTILAIVFSALIHDVDHRGVSNLQLAKEEKELGEKYKQKSIAEQNSLDLAWDLLMQEQFADLRIILFVTQEEMQRFRQVLVNVVLATDIFDKELNSLRKNRWNKAFSSDDITEENNALRATIVIEHIIQASDVAHTMQHWHIYRKWNKRLFQELYMAYSTGRMEKDPSTFWYMGEIGFFDNYVIPLAKKLKDCRVFGVSSDECLDYATQNRNEWKDRGEDIVAEMVKELKHHASNDKES